MDELAMDLATKRVHHRYLKVLVIAKAAVADMLGKFLAVLNRFGIAFEFDADPVPQCGSTPNNIASSTAARAVSTATTSPLSGC
jgi:hypothetical protein